MRLATTTVALLITLGTASTAEPLRSPKAKALLASLRRVPGTTPDMIVGWGAARLAETAVERTLAG